jgi:hypothetical protein
LDEDVDFEKMMKFRLEDNILSINQNYFLASILFLPKWLNLHTALFMYNNLLMGEILFFFLNYLINSEFNNRNNSYFQNIKFTNDEIKYVGNFLVQYIEDKFRNNNLQSSKSNIVTTVNSFFFNTPIKEAIMGKITKDLNPNQAVLL